MIYGARERRTPDIAPERRRAPWWRRQLTVGQAAGIAAASLAVLLGAWYLLTLPGSAVSPLMMPSPQSVGEALVKMLRHPYLGETLTGHVVSSLTIVLTGWAVAGLVGVPLGIAIGWWSKVRWAVFPIFQMLRPVPPLAWIPLAIVWLGIGGAARVSVVFVAAVVPWVMNTMEAVNSVDNLLVQAARTLGASDLLILRRVVIRTGLPTLVAGGRIALGNAWTTLIAAELLAASSGLGFVALNSSRTLDTDILLMAMGVIGVLGALFSLAMRALTHLVAPWAEGA